MKKVLTVFLLFLLIITASYIFLTRKKPVIIKNPPNSVSNPTESVLNSVTPTIISDKGYDVKWIIVRDTDKISLYSNLTDKLTSTDAMKKYGCSQIVSGGFWSAEEKHLGLFVTDQKTIQSSTKSNLLNGYFWIDNQGSIEISDAEPNKEVRIGLQSGPILVLDGKKMTLGMEKDEQARRIVLGTTNKDEVVFLVFYSSKTPLYGPLLENLPDYLNDISKNTNLKFTGAVNLDGGFHSVFISEDIKLTESSTVGSFFCIKP